MKRYINVLIVEERKMYRSLFDKFFEKHADINIVDFVGSIEDAEKYLCDENVTVDLIILGVMDCYDSDHFVEKFLNIKPECEIIILADDSAHSAELAIKCLEKGALDFVLMPRKKERPSDEDFEKIVLPKVRNFSIAFYASLARSSGILKKSGKEKTGTGRIQQKRDIDDVKRKLAKRITGLKHNVVLIGASTGGPEALSKIIPALPAVFPLPVLIVIHMPESFIRSLVTVLNRESELNVKEAVQGEELQAGNVYIAPGGKHTQLVGKKGVYYVDIVDGEQVHNCKPSVDVLFSSAVKHVKDKAIAVLLTGMGEDGAAGMKMLSDQGSLTIAQDKESSVVWGMPGSAVRNGGAKEVVPLNEIPSFLFKVISDDRN